jgi:hypothetical protein
MFMSKLFLFSRSKFQVISLHSIHVPVDPDVPLYSILVPVDPDVHLGSYIQVPVGKCWPHLLGFTSKY